MWKVSGVVITGIAALEPDKSLEGICGRELHRYQQFSARIPVGGILDAAADERAILRLHDLRPRVSK